MNQQAPIITILVSSLLMSGCGQTAPMTHSKDPHGHTSSTPRSPNRDTTHDGLQRTHNTTSLDLGSRDTANDRAHVDNSNKQDAGNKADYEGIAKPIGDNGAVVHSNSVDNRPHTTHTHMQGTSPDASTRTTDAPTESAPRSADNSGQNEIDKSGASMTPMDQGNSEADIEITRTIRKALVSDSTLSTNAQNLKIITRDSVVVLRGPVASQTEIDTVMRHARTASGASRIENQIAITAP